MPRRTDQEKLAGELAVLLQATGMRKPEVFAEAIAGIESASDRAKLVRGIRTNTSRSVVRMNHLFQLGLRTADRIGYELSEEGKAGEPIDVLDVTMGELRGTKARNSWLTRVEISLTGQLGHPYSAVFHPASALVAPRIQLSSYKPDQNEVAFRGAAGIVLDAVNGRPEGDILFGQGRLSHTIILAANPTHASIAEFVSGCAEVLPKVSIPVVTYTVPHNSR